MPSNHIVPSLVHDNSKKQQHHDVQSPIAILLEQIFAQWRRPVASKKAMNLLHQAMHALLYQHTPMAIGTTNKVKVFFIVVVLPATLATTGAIQSE
jgi:hypothetical protein